MHPAARQFVADHAHRGYGHVVELGGRNVNGSIRDLFDCLTYTSVDIEPGHGVDVVADAATWQPPHPVDCVVCCEVLEHTERARDIVFNAATMLAERGRLIVTAACDPREPHSAGDGGALAEGEFYRNVNPSDLIDWMQIAGLTGIRVRVLPEGDVQAVARRLPCG